MGERRVGGSFKIQFVAYCGARDVSARLNVHMAPDARALSAQLYNMLIMVCQQSAKKLLEHAGDRH